MLSARPMDAVIYGLKRAFHSTLRMVRPILKRVGLTPARFDALYALAKGGGETTQMALRQDLGVARATISELLDDLQRRGWIGRTRDRDRRTHRVTLTSSGRAILERAYEQGVGSGTAPMAIDAALTEGDPTVDSFPAREHLDHLCNLVRSFFGDTAWTTLFPWHWDEYLSELESVDPGSDELLPVALVAG